MGIVDATYKYFSDEKIPLSRKVKLTILVVIAAILIDNHYGFSHTVINSYRVDYLMKLESVKQEYKVNVLFPASGNQYKCLPLWQKTKVTKLCQ